MGDPTNALLWVRAAADAADSSASTDRAAVAFVLDHAPELVALRADAGVYRGRARLLTSDTASELDGLADADSNA